MSKLLLVILFVITGVKLVTDGGALVFKHPTVKLLFEDEESKKQNDEQKDSKQDNEDFFYVHYVIDVAMFWKSETLQFYFNKEKLYRGFVSTPFTPPDII